MELATDPYCYNKPITRSKGRQGRRPKSAEASIVIERELCLSCLLSECNPSARECPIKRCAAHMGVYVSRRRRNRLVAKHGDVILRYLRLVGPATCPEIAIGVGLKEGDVYTTMTALILDQHQPIRPTGLRDRAAIYRVTNLEIHQ